MTATGAGWTFGGGCGRGWDVRSRFMITLGLLATCLASAAEEKDPGLLLQTRNEGLATKMFQNKSFYDGKSSVGIKSANVHEFYIPQHYDAKSYATKDFRARTFSQNDLRFETREARTKTDALDQKRYATKATAVKDARESGKSYESRGYADAREFRPQGKSQKSLDAQRNKKPMTMDQVRELLNKNK